MIHFPDHHGEEVDDDEGPPLTWDLDNVRLTTVGIDVGSTTSHLLFARLHLQRRAQELSSRFQIVHREVLYRSPVHLTPYQADGLIDAGGLGSIVEQAYQEAGLGRNQVDTGAVILTGVALQRQNARSVAELFAGTGGRFVCASAGHNLEAMLAAHGSGVVAASVGSSGPRLHMDVGGGTTKLALVADGEVMETAALAVGGRLVVLDPAGVVERVEPAARMAARAAAVELHPGRPLHAAARRRLAQVMAQAVAAAARGERWGLAGKVALTPSLSRCFEGFEITCSGGVAEYLAGATASAGDLGMDLAAALHATFAEMDCRLRPLAHAIRATVIGASQFTVQLSGNTVHVPRPELLPLRNLPVVRPRMDGEPSAPAIGAAIRQARDRLDLRGLRPLAVALDFPGEPHHHALREVALGVADGLADHLRERLPVVLALDADIARSLARVLEEELGAQPDLVVVDGLDLLELDYIDLGALVRPAGVVPVVIKSLAFTSAAAGPAPAG